MSSNLIKTAFIAALFALSVSLDANATTPLQMLPPTPPANPDVACVGGSPAQLLAYSGQANGAINCMPGSIDAQGNIIIYGNSNFYGNVNISKDVSLSSNLSIAQSLTVNSSASIVKDLNVGGNLSLTGNFSLNGVLNMPNNSLVIKGQEISDVTVRTANSLAVAIANCPRGGGTLTVDGNGSINCTASVASSVSFYMTVTGNWNPIYNAVTGGLSCPSNTVDRVVYWFSSGGDNHVFTLHSCTAS